MSGHGADAGRLRVGDNVLLSGFGAGMAWGSVVMRWAVDTVDSTGRSSP